MQILCHWNFVVKKVYGWHIRAVIASCRKKTSGAQEFLFLCVLFIFHAHTKNEANWRSVKKRIAPKRGLVQFFLQNIVLFFIFV